MNKTKTKKIGGANYCIYCGNKSIPKVEYYGNHGREEHHYETCTCKLSKIALDYDKEIAMIQHKKRSLELSNQSFKDLEYKAELKILNERFDK